MAFTGKRVLVTGGAGGLGLETAKKFLEAQAVVTILDKDEDLLQEVKKQYPNVTTIAVNLLDWEATKKAVATIDHIDHLVNNAGVNRRESFLDVSQENLDFIFGVNFKAIVNVSQIVAKKMIQKGSGGTIVNIASLFGKSALANISMYCCSKAAVTMLTKSMAIELAEHNIRVNCVCPTYMITPLTKDYIEKNPEKFEGILNRQAIKRFAQPEETADSVIFLSGPGSTMITGEALGVDGGYLAQ
jgi:L-xylulose reductase